MEQPTDLHRPAVGLLYNPATPELVAAAPDLVEYLAVMPDRLWFDFGPGTTQGRRFHRTLRAMDEVRRHLPGRLLAAHGLGLSLPSAMPLDEELAAAIAQMSADLGGFAWFSEHLNLFLTPKGSVPNAQAGLGLPVVYDEEALQLITGKLVRLRQMLGCPLLLENGSFFTPVPDMEMSEPEFFNRLHAEGRCGMLLDLHNLYVNARNGGMDPVRYLEQLNPEVVEEVHLAGGDDFAGFYMDSHSSLTPPPVWELAHAFLPRCTRLKALTFEFQETYFEDIGRHALVAELERMHELAQACSQEAEVCDAG